MFHYSFQATNCLIQHITIVGNAITFYVNKPDDHESPEFNYLASSLNLQTIIADDTAKHFFLHNTYSPIFKESISAHAHYSFKGDPRNMLQKIVHLLIQYQDDYKAREQSYNICKNDVHNAMIKAGHKQLPPDIQVILDNFDCKIPFIPNNETDELLASFERYQDPANPLHLLDKINGLISELFTVRETLAILRTDEFDDKKLISSKGISNNNVEQTIEKRKKIRSYFDKLNNVRNLLLQYDVNKNDDLLTQANSLYAEIVKIKKPEFLQSNSLSNILLSWLPSSSNVSEMDINNKLAVTKEVGEQRKGCSIL